MGAIERGERIAVAGLVAAVGLAVGVVLRSAQPPPPLPVTQSAAPVLISVHVAGEVLLPGLYVLKPGSRVQDAMLAAHGPTLLADLKRLNLAAPVRDGDRVIIPRIIQPPYPLPPGPPRPAEGAGRAARPPHAAAGDPPAAVNVNTATAAELERLPGIGPTLARRIVEHREAKGLFRRLEDLLEVRGIGPKTLRRLTPLLRLE